MRRYLQIIALALAFMMLLPTGSMCAFAEEDAAGTSPEATQLSEPASLKSTTEIPAEEPTIVPEAAQSSEPGTPTTETPASDSTAAPAEISVTEQPTETSNFYQLDSSTDAQTGTPSAESEDASAAETGTPVSTEDPTVTPAEANPDDPTEMQADEPAETATAEPTETSTVVPSEAPSEAETDPTETPAESTKTPTVEPETTSDVSTETPSTPYEQRELVEKTEIIVTAPAGVISSPLVIREANKKTFDKEQEFIQAVLAASQVKNSIIQHRMFIFSGEALNGKAEVKINDPLIAEIISEYSSEKIKIYVYAYQPEEVRLKDQAKRIRAELEQNIVAFQMTDVTVYDIMIIVQEGKSELTAEPITEVTLTPEESTAPQSNSNHADQTEGDHTEDPAIETLAEEPAVSVDASEAEAPAEPEEAKEAEDSAESEDEATAEAPAESADATEKEAPAESKDESEADALGEPTGASENEEQREASVEPGVEDQNESTDEPDAEAQGEPTTEPTAESPDVPEEEPKGTEQTENVEDGNASEPSDTLPGTTDSVDNAEPLEDPFTVTVSGSYKGKLRYGSKIVLTATFSVEDPNATITWQYSPDGGETIYDVEGEHGKTLVYTFSEENADYSWRVAVYRSSEE